MSIKTELKKKNLSFRDGGGLHALQQLELYHVNVKSHILVQLTDNA